MSEPLRIFSGVLFAAIGGIGVVSAVRRRAVGPAVYSLACAALGIGLLLKLYDADKALGAILVMTGVMVFVEGAKARSAKTILAAVALASAGAGVLAGLITPSTAFAGYLALSGAWGLVHAIRAREAGRILWHGGFAAMGVGMLLLFSTRLFTIPFVLTTVGGLSAFAGMAGNGWQTTPAPGEQRSSLRDSSPPVF